MSNEYVEPLLSFTYFVDKLLVQISILLKHVLQMPMLLYSIWRVPAPLNVDMYLENSKEYTQTNV